MKMTIAKQALALIAAGFLAAGSVQAQDKAANLDQLLDLVKRAQINESQEYRQREAEFRRDKNRQAQLLQQAKAEKARLERRSAELEQTYKENEEKLFAKQEQYEKRLGALKELFGHMTSAAGDMRGIFDVSVVSAQYPGRTEFLDQLIAKMSGTIKLPTLEEIERLWFEMQREMTASGQVVKFDRQVVKPDGEQTAQEVVRVGSFNLVSNGKYLNFDSTTENVVELARQPSGRYLAGAEALQNATTGFTKFGIDPTGPTGGSLLAALIDSPTLVERWHQGGLVGYIITGVFVLAVILAALRLMALSAIEGKVKKQLKSGSANTNNPLGRVLKVAEDNPKLDTENLELKLSEAILKERPAIETGINLLKIIAMVAPLMGLLGTVTGMIITFQALTLFGAEPKAMAGGISAALVTTVLGLCVAIPTVLLHTWVNSKAKRVIHILEEQTAGVIARQAEGR